MSRARLTCRRKRGDHPTSESGLAQGRSAAVPRLDAAAAVSAAARDLGAQGRSGGRADHRPQCQAVTVWGDRPGKRSPCGADPPTCRSGRRSRVSARAATPVSRHRLALAAERPGECPHRPADPSAGGPAAHSLRVVAAAGAGTEPDGSALARAQAAHRSQPAGRVHRCSGRRRRGLGSDADAATGASQGRHGIQTLLAQKAVAELLATYLAATSVSLAGCSGSSTDGALFGGLLDASGSRRSLSGLTISKPNYSVVYASYPGEPA